MLKFPTYSSALLLYHRDKICNIPYSNTAAGTCLNFFFMNYLAKNRRDEKGGYIQEREKRGKGAKGKKDYGSNWECQEQGWRLWFCNNTDT
jgi:hypothetical protein